MAKGSRPVDRDQPFLFPPEMREWLPEDHPVWLVIRAVGGHMDTSAFHAGRRTGGAGTAGFDPDMLVTVLVWAYAHGVTSSREIERLCGTDVAFRVICAGNLPDHVTFARFRGCFPGAVAAFFTEVLVLCARLGMGKLGVVALDGMKIAANASKSANRTEEGLARLAEQAVAAHAAADAAEDELFGAGRRGDEVPPGAWSPRRRDERIAAALAGLRAEREAAQAAEAARAEVHRARRQAGERAGCPPASAAVAMAEENLARVRAARAARLAELEERYAAGQPRRGRPARGGGFTQGYNPQNMPSGDGLIIATELTDDPTDMAWLEPMLAAAEDAAALIEAHRPAASPCPDPARQAQDSGAGGGIGLALADAGYCSEANLTCPGPDRLIAVGKRRDLEKTARGQDAGQDRGGLATQAMRERLKTADGIAAYRQRGHIAETPHGHIKHNMGLRQLSIRGKRKASAEWKFICAVHNLFKALSTGHLTSQALDALTS